MRGGRQRGETSSCLRDRGQGVGDGSVCEVNGHTETGAGVVVAEVVKRCVCKPEGVAFIPSPCLCPAHCPALSLPPHFANSRTVVSPCSVCCLANQAHFCF